MSRPHAPLAVINRSLCCRRFRRRADAYACASRGGTSASVLPHAGTNFSSLDSAAYKKAVRDIVGDFGASTEVLPGRGPLAVHAVGDGSAMVVEQGQDSGGLPALFVTAVGADGARAWRYELVIGSQRQYRSSSIITLSGLGHKLLELNVQSDGQIAQLTFATGSRALPSALVMHRAVWPCNILSDEFPRLVPPRGSLRSTDATLQLGEPVLSC